VVAQHARERRAPPRMVKMQTLVVIAALAGSLWILIEPSSGRNPTPVGATFKDCSACPEMVIIPAGTFMMGSPASEQRPTESPQRLVRIGRELAVGKFEVTFDEWDACVREVGCSHRPDDGGWGRGHRPVINVSWNDAKQYVEWLSRKTGRNYRLPSEAGWEYVARGGTTTAYAYGDFISPEQANYYSRKTLPVGSFAPNTFGVYDLHGNVWEWTEDCWNENYAGGPTNGDAWQSGDCSHHVVRGGSWDDYPWFLRSAERSSGVATTRLNDLGFRAAMTDEKLR